MFPYWEAPVIDVGGRLVYPPIFLIAFAVLLGHVLLVRRASRMGLSPSLAAGFSAAVIIGGFFLAHLVKYFYLDSGFEIIRRNPSVLLKFWAGLASLGGIVGGFVAGIAWLKLRGVSWPDVVRYCDALAFVFPAAWIFGRMHCAWVHDHPGVRTSSWLGVRYPDGVRFDLGLLEVLYLIVVLIAFLWLDRRPRRAGFYLPVFLVPYGMFRFFLDRLHVDTIRYAGLSTDQWGAVAAILIGAIFLFSLRASYNH
jgi:phosphatidylglycerol:prolipoprotein diacylglycerol transferase